MVSEETISLFYPSIQKSGTKIFYDWINNAVNDQSIILNLGAGPKALDKNWRFKGKVKKVTGADIDPLVTKNEDLDEAYVIKDGRLPFPDEMFDLVFSDYVLEHVESPGLFLDEVKRVLKPGCSFFFRTPNKNHYVTIISKFTPLWFHHLIANRVRGIGSGSYDPYKTFYRINSRKQLETLSVNIGFKTIELFFVEHVPIYLRFNIIPFLFGVAYERIVNKFNSLSFLRANIFGRLTK